MNKRAAYWWNEELTESQRKWYVETRFKQQTELEKIAYQAWKEHIKGQRLRVVK